MNELTNYFMLTVIGNSENKVITLNQWFNWEGCRKELTLDNACRYIMNKFNHIDSVQILNIQFFDERTFKQLTKGMSDQILNVLCHSMRQ